jgi:glycosyltransferase involved in cell wall biosynthesis
MAHYAFQLCRGLAHAGAGVTLITREEYELAMLCAPFRVEQTIAPVRKSRFGYSWRHSRQWQRITRRIDAIRPDAVLVGQLRSALDYWPLRRLRSRGRLLVAMHHEIDARPSFWHRRMYALVDRTFVHFERSRAVFRNAVGVPDSRIGVIVHGNEEIFSELADPTFTAATLRRQLGIGEHEKVVLFFGNFAQYKGIDVLLRAFPRVHERTGARLVIAGHPMRGFDLESHLTLAESLSRAVIWVPEYIPSEHVTAWMTLANVIVFPYRAITHAGAPHIAQTYGVPTVATAVGAMQDVIDHGTNGLLVPPDDRTALSDAITRILEDQSLAQRLGEQLRTDAQGRFSWDAIGRQIVQELEALRARR